MKTVCPPSMTITRPCSIVSMPRVTTKPFRFIFRIRKPFTAPTAAPTSRQIGIASHAAPKPRPLNRLPDVGSTSHSAITGASVTVDSSDRSMRPLIRISASARTRTLSSVDCWSIARKLSEVRKSGDSM